MNKVISILCLALLFFCTSCQQNTSTDNSSASEPTFSNFSENEIPVNLNSEEAKEAFDEGMNMLDQGNNLKAGPFFDKVIALEPNCVSAHLYRAYSSTSWAEWAERRDKLLAMRDQANEGEKMIMDMIQNGKDGSEVKGLELAKKLVAKYPSSARAADILADEYQGLNDTDNAREQLKKALELNPNFLLAARNLGGSYLFDSPKDFSLAEKYMAMVAEKAPKSSRAQIDLGDCYRAQNDLEKALGSYTKAAELDPTDEVAHSKAGHANSFLGNFDDARKNFQDSRKASQYGLGAYNFEAFTYLYEGDHKKALNSLTEAINSVDASDAPESNKVGANLTNTFNCALIAMHHENTDQLKEIVGKLKPLSDKLSEMSGSPNAVRNQTANMQYWDAVLATMDGDYDGAAKIADMINTTLESSTDPDKMDRYHRVHAMANYKQKNYKKALEHMLELNPDNIYDSYWTAKAYQMNGDNDKAMEIFKELSTYNFNSVAYALIRNEVKAIVNPSAS